MTANRPLARTHDQAPLRSLTSTSDQSKSASSQREQTCIEQNLNRPQVLNKNSSFLATASAIRVGKTTDCTFHE
ncbi:MAG TPA: hypothetical protein V6D14_15690 [Coleofasciculaceae cyanobacterium]